MIQSPNMVASFERFGYSAEFAILFGLLEALGGLLVLVPGLAAYGTGLIAVVMLGAVYTHLTSGIGSPWMALGYLVLAAALAWLRLKDAYAFGRKRLEREER